MDMNVANGMGYPYTYMYSSGKTANGSCFADEMKKTEGGQNTGFVLHTSNDVDGKAIGAIADHDSSVTVYKTEDFDPENPVYKVKIWDAGGNVTERMVDISKVDPENCDEIEMFAYSSHLSASGECPGAQDAFMGAKNSYSSQQGGSNLFQKENWLSLIQDIMQMQYRAGNMQGYLDYKKVWDFLGQ